MAGETTGGWVMIELLPCPFCGGTNLEVMHAVDKEGAFDWKISCADCQPLHETEAEAVAAWNRRAELEEPIEYELLATKDGEKWRYWESAGSK